jgi:EmrB/QacA subfamily drug resistance transporter
MVAQAAVNQGRGERMLEIDDHRRKWWVLAAMGGVLGLILLDETVVGVALPTIRDDLGMSQVTTHWVVNAYLLVFAGLVVAGGRLGDIIGLRRLFVGGATLFGLASMMAGLAESSVWLIAARGAQGVGAAVIFPASTAILTRVFAPGERGMALGVYAAIGTVFVALGPLVGGFFTDTLSWHWIFWINLPLVAAITLVVLIVWTEPAQVQSARRFDHAGLVTLVLGLGALVFAIMEGPEWGWQHPLIWALLAGGAMLLILFVLAERQAALPLIELDLFRSPLFTVCSLMLFTAQFSQIAMIVFGALYLQDVLQMSALQAGLAMLVAVGPIPFVAVPAGRIADRFGQHWPSIAGLALTGVGMLLLAGAVAYGRYDLMVVPMLIWGAGIPFMFGPSQRAMMNAVASDKQGQAAGIGRGAQQLGGTIGMAVCGTLLAMTGAFESVFLVAGCLSLAVLAIDWRVIDDQAVSTRPA